MSEKIKLTIDGKEVEVNRGTTVLEAARKLNIDIPKDEVIKQNRLVRRRKR